MSAFRVHTHVLLLENELAQTKYLFLVRVYQTQYCESMLKLFLNLHFARDIYGLHIFLTTGLLIVLVILHYFSHACMLRGIKEGNQTSFV